MGPPMPRHWRILLSCHWAHKQHQPAAVVVVVHKQRRRTGRRGDDAAAHEAMPPVRILDRTCGGWFARRCSRVKARLCRMVVRTLCLPRPTHLLRVQRMMTRINEALGASIIRHVRHHDLCRNGRAAERHIDQSITKADHPWLDDRHHLTSI
jgi:hypothetical protein